MRTPSSTYRLQFNREFTFSDAENILDYLAHMGITDIYASPVFKAVTGSMHGYDVVDHNSLNPELGTDDEFKNLQDKRKGLGMGWIQDIVPNHMAFHSENLMLRDLLEQGGASIFSDFFDIEWHHTHESLRGRLLVPFLGSFYSESLERGEIILIYNDDGLFAQYFEHRFPLSLISYPLVFDDGDSPAPKKPATDSPSMLRLQGALHQFRILSESEPGSADYDRVMHAKRMLRELYIADNGIREFMDWKLSTYNSPEEDRRAERLDEILEKQMYRLSFWKVAAEEINYRRFFNINGLISIRVEEKHVFDYTHSLLKELVSTGDITGIRVDHVDGLSDPAGYLRWLRDISDDNYILVEKIISGIEVLPGSWPVQGTTGYDFINQLNGIFCKSDNQREFSRIYFRFTEQEYSFHDLVAEKKRLIIEKHMTGDVDNLAHLLKQISGNDRYGRDITMAALRNALVEVIAFFPVYRTYIDSKDISGTDSGYIMAAFEKARKYKPEYSFEYDFLEKCLTMKYKESMDEKKKSDLLRFIMRFQQYTGPFMAKGFEDTVLYIVNRLVSLNEVGGDPVNFGIPLNRYHDFILQRSGSHRYSMNATSTHDTKRGEDVRCRINVLSEIPAEWKSELITWSRLNQSKKKKHGEPVPDRNDEYFIYQTLLGTFPHTFDNYEEYIKRIKDYMIKSVREAKVHTAWIKPDEEYEASLIQFIDRILHNDEGNIFLKQFLPFQRKTAFYGILNSISQVIVKITCPGVPDFYQGTELWDLRLVDPDNRVRVDFDQRKKMLEYIVSRERDDLPALIRELWESRSDGRIKLFLIRRLLILKNNMKELFTEGEYIPLEATGRYSSSVITFMRRYGSQVAVTVVPRFLTAFTREGVMPTGSLWEDTKIILPENINPYMNEAVTGSEFIHSGEILLKNILVSFPGAVITGTLI